MSLSTASAWYAKESSLPISLISRKIRFTAGFLWLYLPAVASVAVSLFGETPGAGSGSDIARTQDFFASKEGHQARRSQI